VSRRRIAARLRARQAAGQRKWFKKLSCHPWRLWPVGTRNREWWDAMQSGDSIRLLKWHYPMDLVDQLWDEQPLFGLIHKWRAFV